MNFRVGEPVLLAGMSSGRPTEAPPPLITLNIVSSDIFCIAAPPTSLSLLLVKIVQAYTDRSDRAFDRVALSGRVL